MKRTKAWARGIVSIALPCLLLSVYGEALAQFRLHCDGFSAVGGASSSASNKLLAVGGQSHPIGTSSSSNHILNPGFIPCFQGPPGPPPSEINVSSPAAGATWTVGTTQTVAWSSSNVTGNVNIKLSTNGGTSFTITLASNTANDGAESITVPDNPSTTCRVRVESVADPTVFDDNPGNFTIQAAGGCPLSWQANLTVRDAGSNSATLTLGQGANATNDIDAACGEDELPPIPPAGTFDARLELPVSPVKASLKDYRNDSETAINWRIKFQPGAVGNMTFSWNPADFSVGSFFLKDEITGALVNVDMRAQSSYTLTNTAITSLKIEFSQRDFRDVSVVSGWNIISVPLLAADMNVTSLFPDATSAAFGFNGGYVSTPTLVNGKGYWLKFNNNRTYSITGEPVTSRDISVNAGWNIIGPFESSVDVTAITSVPANIVSSAYFGYNSGYVSATTLAVGKGYWVKVSQAGTLHLPSGSAIAKRAEASALPHKQEIDGSWSRIRIEDSAGNGRTLYLAPVREMSGRSELPPLPPAGVFEVRFGSNQYVESLEAGRREIQISSAKYPIKIKAQNFNGRTLNVKDILNGNALNETLTEGKTIVVAAALEKLVLEENALPLRFALSQNQPNPFNPTTIIKFSLPEKVQVKITVYNTVGEKIAELVNRELPAGDHQAEFNGLRYASGVYFYVMEAGTFKDLKKMLIVK